MMLSGPLNYYITGPLLSISDFLIPSVAPYALIFFIIYLFMPICLVLIQFFCKFKISSLSVPELYLFARPVIGICFFLIPL